MTVTTIKAWYLVHKWTSIICTAFILMLCITGLPLIFYHEIDNLLGNEPAFKPMPADTPQLKLESLIKIAKDRRPHEQSQMVFYDQDEPNLIYVGSTQDLKTFDKTHWTGLDARTGEVVKDRGPSDYGFTRIMLQLHVDLFAGLPGKLFLGAMGFLLIVAIVTGIIVYGPFMRKLEYGTVRKGRSPRVKWLDLHNLLGVTTITWALVVGSTGIINTWADLIFKYWQADQMAQMIAPYKGKPPLEKRGDLDRAMETATAHADGMKPSMIAFPGSNFSSEHHYAVYLRGNRPLTKRLLTPALVDAATYELTDKREMAWYAKALFISQPLHFGDYGGTPLQIIWALFDILTIIILGSGLYLWLGRRSRPIEQRLRELEVGTDGTVARGRGT